MNNSDNLLPCLSFYLEDTTQYLSEVKGGGVFLWINPYEDQ